MILPRRPTSLANTQRDNAAEAGLLKRTNMLDHLERFRQMHGLSDHVALQRHAVSIEALLDVHDVTSEFLKERNNKTPGEMLVVLSQINLAARLYEHASGMLLCLACGAWSSAEALSRVVLEGSVSLICLGNDGGGALLKEFFQSGLSDHGRGLEKWEAFEKSRKNVDVLRKIDERKKYVSFLQTFLDQKAMDLTSVPSLASSASAKWPSTVRDRFCRADMEAAYLSTYHRMSSTAHVLAEDTLHWLMLLHSPLTKETQQRAQEEADAYSVMLTRIAMISYLNAAIVCCLGKGLQDVSFAKTHREALIRSVEEIAPIAGVPQV